MAQLERYFTSQRMQGLLKSVWMTFNLFVVFAASWQTSTSYGYAIQACHTIFQCQVPLHLLSKATQKKGDKNEWITVWHFYSI